MSMLDTLTDRMANEHSFVLSGITPANSDNAILVIKAAARRRNIDVAIFQAGSKIWVERR